MVEPKKKQQQSFAQIKQPELDNIIRTMFLVLRSLDLVLKDNTLHDNTILT